MRFPTMMLGLAALLAAPALLAAQDDVPPVVPSVAQLETAKPAKAAKKEAKKAASKAKKAAKPKGPPAKELFGAAKAPAPQQGLAARATAPGASPGGAARRRATTSDWIFDAGPRQRCAKLRIGADRLE